VKLGRKSKLTPQQQQEARRRKENGEPIRGIARRYNVHNSTISRLPAEVSQWSITTLRERLVKIGAKVVRHRRSITFQMAEVMMPCRLFQQILTAISTLRPLSPARCSASAQWPPHRAVGGQVCSNDAVRA
jgi:hypothetical protein